MTGLVEQRLRSREENPGESVPPRDGRRARKLGRRAVVVGAGIGGLAAAGALAQYFARVDILERDQLAATVRSRSGTPQDRHPHGLLAGGLRALDRIFPGFRSDLAAAGAVPVAVAQDMQFERPDVGVLPKRDFGISLLCATRPLIELVLRRARPRSDRCGQPVALQDVDSLEVLGQGTGCRQTAHSRSNNDRPPTELGRTVAVSRWHR